MKLRFLMSHCIRNSVRDKAISKQWINLDRNRVWCTSKDQSSPERNKLYRVQTISEGKKLPNTAWLVLWAG